MDDHQAPTPPPAKNQYPPGYKFMPNDSELILEYLQKKIAKEPIPISEFNEANLKKVNPRELRAKYPKLGDHWYFFSPRERKYENGKRPDRGSDYGFWKPTGADKPVVVGDKTVGFRKALVFYEGKPATGIKTNWKMHEYRVDEVEPRKKRSAKDMTLDDCVLYRIYEKTSPARQPRPVTKKRRKANAVVASPLQASSVDVSAAAVTNQETVPPPLNPNYPYKYNSEPDMADGVEHLLQEPRNGYYDLGNLYLNKLGFEQQPDIAAASCSQGFVDDDIDLGDLYLNELGFELQPDICSQPQQRFHQPPPFAASSSSSSSSSQPPLGFHHQPNFAAASTSWSSLHSYSQQPLRFHQPPNFGAASSSQPLGFHGAASSSQPLHGAAASSWHSYSESPMYSFPVDAQNDTPIDAQNMYSFPVNANQAQNKRSRY